MARKQGVTQSGVSVLGLQWLGLAPPNGSTPMILSDGDGVALPGRRMKRPEIKVRGKKGPNVHSQRDDFIDMKTPMFEDGQRAITSVA